MREKISEFERKMPDGVYYLYVLKCTGGFWYVGVSMNVEKRYERHLSGGGAFFTHEHKPQKLFFKKKLGQMSYWEAERYEDACALEMKMKFPPEKVGGSRYGTLSNLDEVKNFYFRMDGQFKAQAKAVTGEPIKLKSFKPKSSKPKAKKFQKVSVKPTKKFRRKKRRTVRGFSDAHCA